MPNCLNRFLSVTAFAEAVTAAPTNVTAVLFRSKFSGNLFRQDQTDARAPVGFLSMRKTCFETSSHIYMPTPRA